MKNKIELKNRMKTLTVGLLALLLSATFPQSAHAVVGDLQFGNPTSNFTLGTGQCTGNAFLQISANGKLKCADIDSAFQQKSPVFTNIQVSGNIGVGVTNPARALDVAGTAVAPSYFDRDNIAYFMDPAATSNTFRTQINSNLYFGAATTVLRITGEGTGTMTGVYSPTSGTATGLRFYLTNNGVGATSVGYLYGSSGGVGLLTNTGSWGLRAYTTDAHVEIPGTMRSPVYRDLNDPANYYVDPKGTSVIRVLTVNSLCITADCQGSWPLNYDAPTNTPTPVPVPNPQVYTAPTTGVNYVVGAGVTAITVKVWGAGGGLTGAAINTPGKGSGGGGFATAVIPVTPGETLIVRVGQGGSIDATTSTNGGGASGYPGTGGGGGGYSGIFRGATPLVIAGAGGGAAAGGGLGGPGGGTTGASGDADGAAVGCSGTGGTQSAGGTGGASGSSLTGANGQAGTNGGGGAGGGYFGGGGGCLYGNGGGGGGGGSSYIGCAGCTSTSTTSGTNATVANAGDSDYASPAGTGRTGGYGQAVNLRGGDGRVVIRY